MNTLLKEALMEYRTHTIELIECLENEDYDKLELLLNKRQDNINKMSSLEYTSMDFSYCCVELDMLKLQQRLAVLMNEKRAKLKKEMGQYSTAKHAANNYITSFNVDSLFLNKKI